MFNKNIEGMNTNYESIARVKGVREELHREILQITEQLEIKYYPNLRVRKTKLQSLVSLLDELIDRVIAGDEEYTSSPVLLLKIDLKLISLGYKIL